MITKAAFTVSKGPDQQTTSMQTRGEAHLSFPNCSGNVGIPENDRSHLRLSYLTRAETSGIKTVRLSQSVFQISILDLLPPKTSIPQASKGKQRKKAKGNLTVSGRVLLLLFSCFYYVQGCLATSLSLVIPVDKQKKRMSDLQVTQHVLFMPRDSRAGVGSCCSTKLAKSSPQSTCCL